MLFTSAIISRSKARWLSRLAASGLTSNAERTRRAYCASDWASALDSTMRILPDFINENEEGSLLAEIEPYIGKLRYEFSHWDDAIHGYRETEKSTWNEPNSEIIARIKKAAFPAGASLLGHVHVLDLAAEGRIKPHVDSVRFCGDTIAGLSLMSDSVMRLTLVGDEREKFKDFLLPRRSLYIMSGTARYDYNHAILGADESFFEGTRVPRLRRISVICRSEPDSEE